MSSHELIKICLKEQKLRYYRESVCQHTYLISSAERGAGEMKESEQTPRGNHYIRAKIGAGRPVNAVFNGRRFTGEVFSEKLKQKFPERDWILSRILWLCGREVGKNRLGNVDSMQRYIYIHGTPDSEPMGIPKSHGCIRMRNRNIIELFELVSIGCAVEISEH
ncbi:MAG: L,D-transpeptidase [Pseudomonadales bacterium]|nr:L,D-transpeptidase [Pseudomonadales bacterium]